VASRSNAPRSSAVEVVILAGGLSARMGRDKARLRLGGRTLLARVRAAARATGWPVRVVRRDLGPRRGPLGGVGTAFQRSRAERLVFLPCDLPFVSPEWIRRVGQGRARAVFTQAAEGAGFPFALARGCVPVVEGQLSAGEFSLQRLAAKLQAKRLRLPARRAAELLNVNTPEDWSQALARAKAARALH
jgi:molybdenum cofactor guanylyltransferase